MNKKIALINLIEASILLSDEDKLAIINHVPSFTDREVDTLGKYLAAERQFALEHEGEIAEHMDALMPESTEESPAAVYVGSSTS